MKTRLCLFWLLTIFSARAFAAEQTAFDRATQAYDEGRFEEASKGYEELIASGTWNATIFYDLANARYRLGDFCQAILNYERALALDPRHPEADANLRLARGEARALGKRGGAGGGPPR